MSGRELSDDLLACKIAQAAGDLLLQLQQSGLEGKALGQEGDHKANALILQAIRAARPDDAILSEEEKDCATRLRAKRVWIIDPLDGTREYSEKRADWAVHIALSIDNQPALGAVALPGLNLIFSSGSPVKLQPANDPLKMLVSRSRPAAEALYIAKMLNADLLPMGSAGAKAMAVVRGEADIYLHSGGQYEWDNCAPAAVALACGLHVSRTDGSPLIYNQQNPYLPDLLICSKRLAPLILAALRDKAQSPDV